jgi:hypothetical protein
MKRIVLALAASAALALTGCGVGNYDGYSTNGGYSDWDWDLNNSSDWNNRQYCHGGRYNPLPNNQFTCTTNGVTTIPSPRPQQVVPPRNQQRPPQQTNRTAPQQQKPPAQAPKPQAPRPAAPKAPAKSGK